MTIYKVVRCKNREGWAFIFVVPRNVHLLSPFGKKRKRKRGLGGWALIPFGKCMYSMCVLIYVLVRAVTRAVTHWEGAQWELTSMYPTIQYSTMVEKRTVQHRYTWPINTDGPSIAIPWHRAKHNKVQISNEIFMPISVWHWDIFSQYCNFSESLLTSHSYLFANIQYTVHWCFLANVKRAPEVSSIQQRVHYELPLPKITTISVGKASKT